MKVFISSVIGGMESFRDAVDESIHVLGHEAVRAENFSASPSPPRVACLEGVGSSDVMLLILGKRYGDLQDSGLSATHEEYNEAREMQLPVLVMVQKDVEREQLQESFVRKVRIWETGHFTASFSTSEELTMATIKSLRKLEQQGASEPIDSDEILQRALVQLPQPGQLYFYRRISHKGPQFKKGYYLQTYPAQGPQLALALACGPSRNVLRPTDLESPVLSRELQEIALGGPNSLFTAREGTDAELEHDTLLLFQESRIVRLTEFGSIAYGVILSQPGHGFSAIIEEVVREEIGKFNAFSNAVLSHIDKSNRLQHLAIVALLLNADYMDWRTRSFHEQNSNVTTVPRIGAPPMQPVNLSPSTITRAQLLASGSELADDMTIRLRREFLPPVR